ncbi:hypothetical protein CB1_000568065 [Camelus ferus]|nr:hypothetical protein CB1_000568065 [Camelus ferus]
MTRTSLVTSDAQRLDEHVCDSPCASLLKVLFPPLRPGEHFLLSNDFLKLHVITEPFRVPRLTGGLADSLSVSWPCYSQSTCGPLLTGTFCSCRQHSEAEPRGSLLRPRLHFIWCGSLPSAPGIVLTAFLVFLNTLNEKLLEETDEEQAALFLVCPR